LRVEKKGRLSDARWKRLAKPRVDRGANDGELREIEAAQGDDDPLALVRMGLVCRLVELLYGAVRPGVEKPPPRWGDGDRDRDIVPSGKTLCYSRDWSKKRDNARAGPAMG
jgi:hypothetical protein